MAITMGDRQVEQDSVEGDLLGEGIMRTLITEAHVELLTPVRLGIMRNLLRHRRVTEAVSVLLWWWCLA